MNSESENIIFTGTDGLTCHQFIRAVRQHAFEAGKQSDDRWIAGYTAIRLDGDALVWYESLDDETQNDWKLLRRAMLSQYAEPASNVSTSTPRDNKVPGFVFVAKDKEECRSFIKYIRSTASAEGKENDSAWMIKLAYPCFSGKALEWHALLPSDVQRDWQRLERAILRYPARFILSISPPRIYIADWFFQIRPSGSLEALRSQEDWLNQARERRRMYLEANEKSLPCWLLVETESEIPDNAFPTGSGKSGEKYYSARAWQGRPGLVVGKCGRNLPGAHLPLGNEVKHVRPFEVLVGDPSYFQWITVPLKGDARSMVHPPFEAVEAGIDTYATCRATFIHKGFQDGGWHPGKVHSSCSVSFFSYNGREIHDSSVRVLAWAT